MSDRDLERGPKGDHGQHGAVGEAGVTGQSGDRGVAGERGKEGLAGLPGERGPVGDVGEQGLQGEIGPAGRNWKLGGWALGRLLAFLLVGAASIYSSARTFNLADTNRQALQQIKNNQAKIEEEGVERRDQICLSAEREHLRDVTDLKDTYSYLVRLSVEDTRSSLNRTVALQVPRNEAKARTDVAPDFCDEPGVKAEALFKKTHGRQGAKPVGLPEPDPVIPKRPERVTRLIKEAQAALNRGMGG